jgi:hypothetical protein
VSERREQGSGRRFVIGGPVRGRRSSGAVSAAVNASEDE